MGDKSSIEWLNGGATWNPIRARRKSDGKKGWACVRVSPGCERCYSEKQNVQCGTNPTRFGTGLKYTVPSLDQVELFLDEETLLQPLSWKKPRLIFPCSMTDWMADFVPDEWRDKMLAVMALTPQHTYLTLTKRADRQRDYFTSPELYRRLLRQADWIRLDTNTKPAHVGITDPARFPLKNHWTGVSVENPDYLKRLDPLRDTPAAIRWCSFEPLLADLGNIRGYLQKSWRRHGCAEHAGHFQLECVECMRQPSIETPGIDWAVGGFESGPHARPGHPVWALHLRDQCIETGTAFFWKQNGEWHNGSVNPRAQEITMYSDGRYCDFTQEAIIAEEQRSGKRHNDYLPTLMSKVGKKAAGRLLDGKEWSEYPKTQEGTRG